MTTLMWLRLKESRSDAQTHSTQPTLSWMRTTRQQRSEALMEANQLRCQTLRKTVQSLAVVFRLATLPELRHRQRASEFSQMWRGDQNRWPQLAWTQRMYMGHSRALYWRDQRLTDREIHWAAITKCQDGLSFRIAITRTVLPRKKTRWRRQVVSLPSLSLAHSRWASLQARITQSWQALQAWKMYQNTSRSQWQCLFPSTHQS